jgi:hypothetical protein
MSDAQTQSDRSYPDNDSRVISGASGACSGDAQALG